MEFKADLHCHSTCSDGTLSPFEILELAKKTGLQGLSITDHDTIEAYTEAFFSKAKDLEIEIIPGVEFSCQQNHHPVHILGYNFSLEDEGLKHLCKRHHTRRKHRNEAILMKLNAKGLTLSPEELQQSNDIQVIGRPHIASLMIKKGYVKSIDEAFKKYLGEGKPCYDPGEVISVEETVEIIHKANGKAFIAHPHLISRNSVLKELLNMSFDGIECFYANFPMKKNLKWVEVAKSHSLLMSGGSDFHGSVKPSIALGASFTNLEFFNKIRGGF